MVEPQGISFDQSSVTITWPNGHISVYSNKNLRESCPCALCHGEPGLFGKYYAPKTRPMSPPDIRVLKYQKVGRYAVSFVWSDGHSSGIYPYDYMLTLCECDKCVSERSQQEA
jgi:DUF971 family protein